MKKNSLRCWCVCPKHSIIYIGNRLVAHENMDNSIFCSTALIRVMKGETLCRNLADLEVWLSAIGIDGELLAGSLPKKQFKMVVGWLAFHEEEAYKAWNLAVRGEHFDKIAPM